MPYIRCPDCRTIFTVSASAFGQEFLCKSCSSKSLIDTDFLARFQLPEIIRIQLLTPEGTPFTSFPVPVMIDYGYQLPPLLTDSAGQLVISRDMFAKAQRDEISTGIMDHRGDYSLRRYILCKIPSESDARAASKARATSGWPILDFERELYGDFERLLDAYIPPSAVTRAESTIDLAEEKDVVNLGLIIKLKNEAAI